jgi:hypothetical protein
MPRNDELGASSTLTVVIARLDRATQYSRAPMIKRNVAAYWILRWSLSSGGAERRPVGAPRNDGFGPITSAAAQTARWFTPTGSIRRIHRRQAQEIFAEKACAKDKIVEPIQQIHPTGKSPKTLSSPFRKNIPLNPSGKSVL